MDNLCMEKSGCPTKAREEELACGYKEMSRINLGLAEDGLASDNEALELCEQKFAECE